MHGCGVLLQIRMSWCVMQDSIVGLKTDMDVIFERTGGRTESGEKPERFITMSQCQVCSWARAPQQCLHTVSWTRTFTSYLSGTVTRNAVPNVTENL